MAADMKSLNKNPGLGAGLAHLTDANTHRP